MNQGFIWKGSYSLGSFAIFWKKSEISSILDWSENFTKNQENYLKTNGEIRLRKYCTDF